MHPGHGTRRNMPTAWHCGLSFSFARVRIITGIIVLTEIRMITSCHLRHHRYYFSILFRDGGTMQILICYFILSQSRRRVTALSALWAACCSQSSQNLKQQNFRRSARKKNVE
jgi:hypothetical protein